MIAPYDPVSRRYSPLSSDFISSKYPGIRKVTPVQRVESDPIKESKTDQRYGTLIDIMI